MYIPKSRHHHILELAEIRDFEITVKFTDGIVKKYDFSSLMSKHNAFSILKNNPTLFKQASLEPHGIAISWNDDIDISADELYVNGETITL